MSTDPYVSPIPLRSDERLVILASVFSGGAILMGFEILGFNIIGMALGSALRETSVVISVFLAAMKVGGFEGGRLADRPPRVDRRVSTRSPGR